MGGGGLAHRPRCEEVPRSQPRAARGSRTRRRAGTRGCRSSTRGWGNPVAVARHRPVTGVGHPLAELAVLDVLGYPGDLLVQLPHAVTDFRNPDEPARHRLVDERIAAPPAVR